MLKMRRSLQLTKLLTVVENAAWPCMGRAWSRVDQDGPFHSDTCILQRTRSARHIVCVGILGWSVHPLHAFLSAALPREGSDLALVIQRCVRFTNSLVTETLLTPVAQCLQLRNDVSTWCCNLFCATLSTRRPRARVPGATYTEFMKQLELFETVVLERRHAYAALQ
jgi:hypothetical protein